MGISSNFGRMHGWGERSHYLQDSLGCIAFLLSNTKVYSIWGAFKDAGWEWDFRWRRPLFDNEIEMAVSFLSEVARHPIQPHIGDKWEWKAEPSGQYTAKSAYYVMRGEIAEQQ